MESQILNCIMYVAGIIGVAAAVFWRGQVVGRQKAVNAMKEKNDDAIDKIKDSQDRVEALADSDLDEKNMKWVKKKN